MTMNTQNETRVNEQEYSDIKVSKKTAKILQAMAKSCELYNYIDEDVVDEKTVEKMYGHIDAFRDELERNLISSIHEVQIEKDNWRFTVI